MTALPEWDDGTADLIAMVAVTREAEGVLTPGQAEALAVLGRHSDHLACLAAAVKLLSELVTDLDMCPECFREYAARAVAR
jgi:hypothetical protein